MNSILNATGWGEAPGNTVELKYPEWMSGSYLDPVRQRENLTAAEVNKAIGRERRKARFAENHRRNTKVCTVGFLAVILLLAVTGSLWG